MAGVVGGVIIVIVIAFGVVSIILLSCINWKNSYFNYIHLCLKSKVQRLKFPNDMKISIVVLACWFS
jgi:hypothetical protein